MKKRLLVLFSSFLFMFGSALPGLSQMSGEDLAFFQGKTMTMIVATNPGGSYDQYGQLFAKALERKFKATVPLKYVIGEGMIIGANEIYKAAPDGLTVGTFNIGLLIAQLREEKNVNFDLRRFTWLGNAAAMSRFFSIRTALPQRNFEDIRKLEKPLRIPTSGVGSSAHNDTLMIRKILGLKLEPVSGYGGAETDKAIERGEMDGRVESSVSLMPSVQKGFLRPILIIAEKRDPGFPDVPTLSEVSPREMQPIVNLMVAISEIARPFAAPPGFSEGRARALQEAFKEAFSDKELVTSAQKSKMPLNYYGPGQVQKLIADALNQPADVIEFLKSTVR
jgi:tripartite-type tricarboxylate transporter receptor subunit TctC